METHLDKSDITGLILAGGQGKRMGSIDKGLQLFLGKPLFSYAVKRLKPQVTTILLNANQNIEAYKQSGLEVISDEPLTYAGPLAGFLTGLKHCKTPYLLCVPCDSPFFPETLLKQLYHALINEKTNIAIATTGSQLSFKAHPVFCLMKKTVLSHLDIFLNSGQRKIEAWYSSLKTSLVHFSDEAAFSNINTIEELKALENQSKI